MNKKNIMQKFLIFSMCNTMLFSCGNDDLPQFNQLNSLRVIALTTPTPEVSPGATVTITPVVSDVTEATVLKDSVSVCMDLGVAYGVTPTCEGNPTLHTDRVLVAPGAVANWTGNADSFNVTVPDSATIFLGRSEQEKFNGVNYLIEYILTNSNGTQIKSFRRIVVSTKTPKNTNPTVTDIFSNGVSLIAPLPFGSVVQLTSDLTAGSAESFQLQDYNGLTTTQSELISTTWMITDGETKYFRSDVGQSNEYTLPAAAPVGRSVHIFAVARDNRGGVTVVRKQF